MKIASNVKTISISVTLVFIGAFVWETIRYFSHEKEAFDSGLYFLIGLPVMFGATFLAGYWQQNRSWLFGISVVITQPILLFSEVPSGPLFMVGIVLFGFLSFGASRVARFGESIRGKSNR